MQLGSIGTTLRACLELYPVESSSRRRLPHQQPPVPWRPAPSRRLHLHADLRRGTSRRLRRHRRAPPRHRRRRARPQHPLPRDVYQEGLLFPPRKFSLSARLERRRRSSACSRPTSACPTRRSATSTRNSPRTPSASSRVQELCSATARTRSRRAMAELLDYSERRMRAAIARCPTASTRRGRDRRRRRHRRPLVVHAKVTDRRGHGGGRFRGTAAQVSTQHQLPVRLHRSRRVSLREIRADERRLPSTRAASRPVTVTAPYGCSSTRSRRRRCARA